MRTGMTIGTIHEKQKDVKIDDFLYNDAVPQFMI